MSTTLRAESFADRNILEATQLTADVAAGATSITVTSTAGFSVGQPIFVGQSAREGCEGARVLTVTSATQLALSAALTHAHGKYESVVGAIGDSIRFYRASNVDGTAPDDDSFTTLVTRVIDADQQSTYYVDSTGSSDYWYKYTYINTVSSQETGLADSTAVRGDDFGHYASLTEICREAGFENAHNLSDERVDQARRMAEAEINTSLSGYYTVPFTTVPAHVNALTIQLAAGLLLLSVYGSAHAHGKELVTASRTQLKALRSEGGVLADTSEGTVSGSGVSSWPDETTEDARMIESIWDRF